MTFGLQTSSIRLVNAGEMSADDRAIIAELNDRVRAFGGLDAFVRAHPDLDKRNVGKHLTHQLPTLPILMKYLGYLGVPWGEFFDSANRRTQ